VPAVAIGADRNAQILMGESESTRTLRASIELAARSTAKVLLLGETGSGKEVAARLIHALGARKEAPFIAMNCSGVPDTLFASEMFGHVRGSFTGAYFDNPGRIAAADGGTFFLDEVAELNLAMQAALLRFLETGETQPIGASTCHRFDVRLIAATNRDLHTRIAKREFREDLFYRLDVLHIRVPSLRDRSADIAPLLRHYLAWCSQEQGAPCPDLTPGAEALLCAYPWPGNVRQLKNIAERLVVRQGGEPVRIRDLPAEILLATNGGARSSPAGRGVPN
jgi:DNA-binding NtrC family response regulator